MLRKTSDSRIDGDIYASERAMAPTQRSSGQIGLKVTAFVIVSALAAIVAVASFGHVPFLGGGQRLLEAYKVVALIAGCVALALLISIVKDIYHRISDGNKALIQLQRDYDAQEMRKLEEAN